MPQWKKNMDFNELANLIFPDAKDISYYEEKYPEQSIYNLKLQLMIRLDDFKRSVLCYIIISS